MTLYPVYGIPKNVHPVKYIKALEGSDSYEILEHTRNTGPAYSILRHGYVTAEYRENFTLTFKRHTITSLFTLIQGESISMSDYAGCHYVIKRIKAGLSIWYMGEWTGTYTKPAIVSYSGILNSLGLEQ